MSEINEKMSGLPILTKNTHRLCYWNERPGTKEAFDAVLSFVNGGIKPPMLLLNGGPGLGKTYLAIAIGWYFLSEGKSVAYYHAQAFINTLIAAMKPGSEQPPQTLIDFAEKVKLLILDDIGAHNDTEYAGAQLDEIINTRYENQMATVLTSNTLEISPRILDRCREGKIAILKGESYRKVKAHSQT